MGEFAAAPQMSQGGHGEDEKAGLSSLAQGYLPRSH